MWWREDIFFFLTEQEVWAEAGSAAGGPGWWHRMLAVTISSCSPPLHMVLSQHQYKSGMLPPLLMPREASSTEPSEGEVGELCSQWAHDRVLPNLCLRKSSRWQQRKRLCLRSNHTPLWQPAECCRDGSLTQLPAGSCRDCQPGTLIPFHVASPCSLGFTECGDWIKKGVYQQWERSYQALKA